MTSWLCFAVKGQTVDRWMQMGQSLDDFCQLTTIRRTGSVAEIIIDHVPEGPVRLLGFTADASRSDFAIYEVGYSYLIRFREKLRQQ